MKARPPSTTLSWFKSNRSHLLAFCATMVTPLTGFSETCFSAPPTPRDTLRVLQYPIWICACGNIAKTVCLIELKLVMRFNWFKDVSTAVEFSSFGCHFEAAGCNLQRDGISSQEGQLFWLFRVTCKGTAVRNQLFKPPRGVRQPYQRPHFSCYYLLY